PGRLLVLGGGVSGVELAQAWASFGSRVAVIEAMPRLLGREESFAAELVHAALVVRGVAVRVGVKATAASRNGGVGLELETGGSLYGRGASGTTRFVIDHDRELLVGATFTGAEVAEFVHAATIAIVGEVPLQRLWHAVPSFPTRSEVWLRLLETYGL